MVSVSHCCAPGTSCSPHHHRVSFTFSVGYRVDTGADDVGVVLPQAAVARTAPNASIAGMLPFIFMITPHLDSVIWCYLVEPWQARRVAERNRVVASTTISTSTR